MKNELEEICVSEHCTGVQRVAVR